MFSHPFRLITYTHGLWAQSAARRIGNGYSYAQSKYALYLAGGTRKKIIAKAGTPRVIGP